MFNNSMVCTIVLNLNLSSARVHARSQGSVVVSFKAAVSSGAVDAGSFASALRSAIASVNSSAFGLTVDASNATVGLVTTSVSQSTSTPLVGTTESAFPLWAEILIGVCAGALMLLAVAGIVRTRHWSLMMTINY